VFRKGDKVIYPHHGAAVIEGFTTREFHGEQKRYFVLKLVHGDLTLMVPCENTEEVGLREVVSKREVKKVLEVLRQKAKPGVATNWSRRYKTNIEKIRSGDIYQVAEVVRNLAIRERDKGLSAGEKRMLAKAREILLSELIFAVGVDAEKAEGIVDKVLQDAHAIVPNTV
jgi:CarD family transcriptional regulator